MEKICGRMRFFQIGQFEPVNSDEMIGGKDGEGGSDPSVCV